MKKIAALTGTRADYGLLRNLLLLIEQDKELELTLIVTGSHLSQEFGMTITEIENDGFSHLDKLDILMSSDSNFSVTKSMGIELLGISDIFCRTKPDLLLLLGDRYEIFAAAAAAVVCGIKIAHIHGGETTEGAMDEMLRHSITKMSHLHFTSTAEYSNRVVQLGEDPERVFVSGAPGVENALNIQLLDKAELENSLDFILGEKYAIITFHPITLEGDSVLQLDELLTAIENISAYDKNLRFIFTKANADQNGKKINSILSDFCNKHTNNTKLFTSLGMIKYLSALKHAKAVIGNSSSGIIEAPSFNVPTVNIGNRQKGRISADSVIHCSCITADIEKAIHLALSSEFSAKCGEFANPYEKKGTAQFIYTTLKDWLKNDKLLQLKKFHDI